MSNFLTENMEKVPPSDDRAMLTNRVGAKLLREARKRLARERQNANPQYVVNALCMALVNEICAVARIHGNEAAHDLAKLAEVIINTNIAAIAAGTATATNIDAMADAN